MKAACQNCQKPLTGKQRLFCSEACRKQYRRRQKSGRKADTALSLFVREWAASDREQAAFTNKRTFAVRVLVHFASDQPVGEWDHGLINDYLAGRIAQLIIAYLELEHPEWEIRVEVQSRHRPES